MPRATRTLAIIAALLMASAAPAQLVRTPSPPDAQVYIVQPADGAVVSGPVRVVFGLTGMGVAPAGVELKNTGHHHLIIDDCLPDFDKPIPADDKHIHFGGGQTETVIELEPGEHTLTLLLADYRHLPHERPLYSKTITITVE